MKVVTQGELHDEMCARPNICRDCGDARPKSEQPNLLRVVRNTAESFDWMDNGAAFHCTEW